MSTSQAQRVLKLEKRISQMNDVINELVKENYELQKRYCEEHDMIQQIQKQKDVA